MTPQTLATAMGIPMQRAIIWAQPLTNTMRINAITTPERIAAFIAQCGHESQGLQLLDENLNYSAERLCEVWPTRFYMPPDAPGWVGHDGVIVARANALEYGGRPIAIGNRAYRFRNGNGDEDSGDGNAFRGRGPLQLTGHDNYRACGTALRIDLVASPARVAAEPDIGAAAAGWFWTARGCNALVDSNDFRGLTERINGGHEGLTQREARFTVALTTLRSLSAEGGTLA